MFSSLNYPINRWYQNPNLDISQIAPILLNSTLPERNRDQVDVAGLPAYLRTNPLAMTTAPPTIGIIGGRGTSRDSQVPPPTQTLSSRVVHHEVQAALRPLYDDVQTAEQLDSVLERLRAVRREQIEENADFNVRDPPVIRYKGKPRTARITHAREGVIRGGGGGQRTQPRQTEESDHEASDGEGDEERDDDPCQSPPRKRRAYKCGLCHKQGHNRQHCPTVANR